MLRTRREMSPMWMCDCCRPTGGCLVVNFKVEEGKENSVVVPCKDPTCVNIEWQAPLHAKKWQSYSTIHWIMPCMCGVY